jgi:hypothetical protein
MSAKTKRTYLDAITEITVAAIQSNPVSVDKEGAEHLSEFFRISAKGLMTAYEEAREKRY